jgi:hypothetical protein
MRPILGGQNKDAAHGVSFTARTREIGPGERDDAKLWRPLHIDVYPPIGTVFAGFQAMPRKLEANV